MSDDRLAVGDDLCHFSGERDLYWRHGDGDDDDHYYRGVFAIGARSFWTQSRALLRANVAGDIWSGVGVRRPQETVIRLSDARIDRDSGLFDAVDAGVRRWRKFRWAVESGYACRDEQPYRDRDLRYSFAQRGGYTDGAVIL